MISPCYDAFHGRVVKPNGEEKSYIDIIIQENGYTTLAGEVYFVAAQIHHSQSLHVKNQVNSILYKWALLNEKIKI